MPEESAANAEVICQTILQEAEEQAREILKRAHQEAEKVRQAGQQQAEKLRQELLAEYQLQRLKLKDFLFANLQLEKRKILLEEKNAFSEAVLKEVTSLAEQFRTSPDYPNFLVRCLAEGARVLDQDRLVVFYSPADEPFFQPAAVEEMKKQCAQVRNRPTEIILRPGDFQEIGLVLQSGDGRMIFDNRFSARLKRKEEQIRRQLLKENL